MAHKARGVVFAYAKHFSNKALVRQTSASLGIISARHFMQGAFAVNQWLRKPAGTLSRGI